MMMGWLLGWRQSIVLAIYGLACRKSSKMTGFRHLATEPVHCSPYLWTGSKGAWCLWGSHVALEAQCDVALPQYDVAGLFSPFSELKEGVLTQPCRVGGPMRRGSPPTRRRGRLFAIFRAKRGCPASAMSCWRPNATWLTSNSTWRVLFRPFPG